MTRLHVTSIAFLHLTLFCWQRVVPICHCTSVRVSLPESVLSFHHMGSEDPTQAGKCLHPLSHLAHSSPWVFKAGIMSVLLLILQHPLLLLAFAKCSEVNKTSHYEFPFLHLFVLNLHLLFPPQAQCLTWRSAPLPTTHHTLLLMPLSEGCALGYCGSFNSFNERSSLVLVGKCQKAAEPRKGMHPWIQPATQYRPGTASVGCREEHIYTGGACDPRRGRGRQ